MSKIASICSTIFLIQFASMVFAQGSLEGPCKAEIDKLCPGMKVGSGLLICLKEKHEQFSDKCKDKMAAAREKLNADNDVCKADTEKLCKGIKPGGGRIVECLKAKKEKVSAACRAVLAK
jgi:Golgi apparatus protein 1